LTKTVNQN